MLKHPMLIFFFVFVKSYDCETVEGKISNYQQHFLSSSSKNPSSIPTEKQDNTMLHLTAMLLLPVGMGLPLVDMGPLLVGMEPPLVGMVLLLVGMEPQCQGMMLAALLLSTCISRDRGSSRPAMLEELWQLCSPWELWLCSYPWVSSLLEQSSP